MRHIVLLTFVLTVLIGCAKPGYTLVRMTKRAGSTKQKQWVQADCILRKAR